MFPLVLLFSVFGLNVWGESYLQNLSFESRTPVRSVVFGSPRMGYFEAPPKKTGNTYWVEFYPPTYEEPIQIYAQDLQLKCVRRIHFKNPTPLERTPRITLRKGTLTPPYFLSNAYFKKEGHPTLLVLNRQGEVVWSYLSKVVPDRADKRTKTLLAKKWDDNHFGVLAPYSRSHFEIIDWEGKRSYELEPSKTTPPLPLHHDFLKVSEKEVLFLSNSSETLRKPLFFWKPKMSFLGSPLYTFDLEKKLSHKIWDYLGFSNPFKDSNWTWNEVDSAGNFWSSWGTPPVQHNFVHANSIDKNERGILLSLRNLNKLVLLSPDGKKVLWSHEKDLFRQHHATFLPNGGILVFDNGRKKSRILELGKKVFEPDPPVFSHRQGSAFLFEQSVIGFFPSTLDHSREPNRIVEFHYDLGSETARLEMQAGSNAAGYRAEPVAALAGAKPFSGSVPPCELTKK